ncbi:hypothetical protein SK128_008952, partial [Halocaridina rubra]
VLLLTGVVAAAPTTFDNTLDNIDPNPSYSVAWEVKNEPTYDDKSHQETLRDGTVEGQYSYLRPDGKMQVVTYRANDEIGFVVNVDVQDVMPAFGSAGRPASADIENSIRNIGGNTGRSFTSASSSTGAGSFGTTSRNSGRSFTSSPSIGAGTRSSGSSRALSTTSSSLVQTGVGPFRSRATGKSFSSTSLSSNSISSGASFIKNRGNSQATNNFNRATSNLVTSRPVANVPVIPQPSSGPSIQAAFVQRAPVLQSVVAQPSAAVQAIPVIRQQFASSPFRPVPTVQPAKVVQPAFSPQITSQRAFSTAPVVQRTRIQPATRRPPQTTAAPPPPPPTTTTPPPPPPPTPLVTNRGRSFTGNSQISSQGTGVAHVTFSSPTHQYSYPLVVNK